MQEIQQPEKSFIEELKKPVHSEKPENFGHRGPAADQLDVSGMYLSEGFPDPQGVLETAYADFALFTRVYEINGNRYPVITEFQETECFEAYTINIAETGIRIQAADTEGIRRGLIYLEDLIRKEECAALKKGPITRKPVIKTRITRGFFSPTNRPPFHIDELYNEEDYYPDAYLNRLAHDGNNGIWIYTKFPELLKSDYIEEYGKESERRLEKLRRVVKKCARYGIKVYVFGVEPSGLAEELRTKYPELLGAPGWDRPAFCTRSDRGREYCIESTRRLFTEVPDLGGYIDITAGERVTTCPSVPGHDQCPRCSRYSRGENLAYNADLIREGMRQAGSRGEFISWTYGHRDWRRDDIREYVRKAPEDVCLMQNFDDYGFQDQLGKPRFAMDYWLSYVGPSELFTDTAEAANAAQKHLFAKMQVCCSHELATVPYIPVPELLFEKYREAYRYQVEGILQCWYFGNYPSIMSKTAGELSFCSDFTDPDSFLKHMAGICYGNSAAEQVAAAWKCFAEGYRHYPTNIMFSYYGPMHDGVVWELALKPVNKPLARTWQLPDPRTGDRIGEALQCGHTLEEARVLCAAMRDWWKKGLALLPKEVVGEQSTVAEALGILFASGCNILDFYALRERLGYGAENGMEFLEQMERLVEAEIENSRAMIPLCQQDNRLGYHSEAEGFKFFPALLEDRIQKLEMLLCRDFPEVRQRIREKKAPLAYYLGESAEGYALRKEAEASWETVGEEGAFRVYYDDRTIWLEIRKAADQTVAFSFEYRLLWPSPEMVWKDGVLDVEPGGRQHQSILGETLRQVRQMYQAERTDWGLRIRIDRQSCGWENNVPMKLRLKIGNTLWVRDPKPTYTLGKSAFSPGDFGWLLP